MTASFDLSLDTRAPVVTWGAVDGATAGDTLTVLYSTDEPLAVAQLWLPDGRKLDMTIAADRLTVLLPPDTPDGNSWIHVFDDVLNPAPRQAVQIAGVIVVPPPEPPQVPGPPQGGRERPSIHPDRVETRVVRLRSRGEGRSRSATRRTPRVLRSRSMIHDSWFVNYEPRTSRSRGEGRSAARTLRYADLHTRGVGSSSAVVHRRDGPEEEAALVALDLL